MMLVETPGAAFSIAPIFFPKRLVLPDTPRLNELISRRKRFKYWAPTGLPTKFVGLRSVKRSFVEGGEMKSLMLMVQLPPPWQLTQPASENSWRPAARSGTVAPAPP